MVMATFLSSRILSKSFGKKSFFTHLKCLSTAQQACQNVHLNVKIEKADLSTTVAKYGGRNRVTMLMGDGIGPELLGHLETVFHAAKVPVEFEKLEINSETDDPNQMQHALLSVKRNGVAIKGNIETRHNDPLFRSMNVELRNRLNLFANVIHCKSIKGVKTRHENIDIVLIRENMEGEYSQLEHESVKGVVESLKTITALNSERIARFAFEYAVEHKRQKITAVHKANIMKLADGLFLETCRRVSKEYPNIEFDDIIIDNCSMQMVSRPQQFDLLVMPNLYGNILGNVTSGLIGGPGVTAGMDVGRQYAVFETGTRNTGRNIQGQNMANPTGMLMSGCDLLNYLGHKDHADKIKTSTLNIISSTAYQTQDIGGNAGTNEVVQAVIDDLRKHV